MHPDSSCSVSGLEAGDLLGPNFIVGAPSANGNTDAHAGSRGITHPRGRGGRGTSFMKIHPGIPLDAWDRMVAVANEVGLTFAGSRTSGRRHRTRA